MKKNAVIYISIVTSATVIGTGSGILIKRITGQENIVYVGDATSIYADSQEILKKYENYKGNSLIDDFQTWELINVALEKYRRCDYSYSISKGKAMTIVEQEIRNFQIKNGNDYFEESLSKSSMVAVAKRMYQKGLDGNVSIYDGTIPSSNVEKGRFTEAYSNLSSDEYKNYLGRTLDEMFIYAISEKTVIDQKTIPLSDGYQLFVSLSPNKSTINYQTQMKNISNLDQRPVFESVFLTYEVDKDMMLKSLHIDESYTAKMTITVSITNNIDTYYYPNKIMDIPSYNQNTNYSIGGEENEKEK